MALTLATGIAVVLMGMSSITILNVFTMLRLGRAPQATDSPMLSILIPARDEAKVIEQTIRAIVSQSYSHFEIILLDDHSTDQTAVLAQAAAKDDQRFRVLQGAPLPAGWAGKNWACHQLAEAANGDILIFTDADVRWQPHAVQALVNELDHTQADMLTVWSTQHTETPGERLCVPLMAMVILGYLPHLAVNHIPHPAFAAANGQCLALRREAYRTIGGHQRVKGEIVEDIRLAQAAKRAGLRLRMVDGNQKVTCRMYTSWDDVKNGYAKNITAGYGDSLLGLAAGTLFHWVIFLLPWVWALVSMLQANWIHLQWSLTLIALGVLVRALTAAATHQRAWDALLMPLSVLLMTHIAAQSAYWYLRYGGPRWKGRTIIRHERKEEISHG